MIVPQSATPKQSVPQASAPYPVTADEFARAASPLLADAPFAMAVSGGADSTALLHLAVEWCLQQRRDPPIAVTVDHGLRPAASQEAEEVARWAAGLGIRHAILKWRNEAGASNLQARARAARYSLIADWMRVQRLGRLATGHTLDDQAETLLMRLARGSGLEGLSGMQARRSFPVELTNGLELVRPLLSFSHARLVATLKARNLPWVEDPSNEDERFMRVQVRKLLPSLNSIGLSTARLAETASHLSRANSLVDTLARELDTRSVRAMPWGYALVATRLLGEAHEELALRVLARMLKRFGGSNYAPEFEQVTALLEWLRNPGGVSGRTLGGCRLVRRDPDTMLVAREEGALELENPVIRITPGQTRVWDGRFAVSLPAEAASGEYEVKAMGAEGIAGLPAGAEFPPHEPRRIAATCPGIWRAGRLVSAPCLGFHEEIRAEAGFLGFA